MLDLDHIAIDPVLASEGKWVEFSGGKFLIARWNNRKADALRNELHMEFYSALSKAEEGKMPTSTEGDYAKIQARIMAETILLDWDNVSHKGKKVKYTPEVGLKYLENPAFVDLYQFINNESVKRENYISASTEEIVTDVKLSADS